MREQKLSGAYKLADNRPTSPVDAHAHATRRDLNARAPILDLLRYLRYDTTPRVYYLTSTLH